jgi:hypothetical protein
VRGALAGAALAGVCMLGCGATPVEQAKRQWARARAAQARGDLPAREVALKGTLQAADRDTRKVLDAESAQLNLLRALAWADQSAASPTVMQTQLEPRLGALGAAPARLLPSNQRPIRLAAQCRWAADAGRHHYAALCWDAVLTQVPKGDGTGLRRAATQGLIRANGARFPGWLSLKGSHGDPTLTRLLGVLHADPLDVDAVTLVARSLEDLCEPQSRFEAQIAGWRAVQTDLLDAVIALDGFADHDLRCTARSVRAAALTMPLCGPGPTPKVAAQAPPAFWPACPADVRLEAP